MQRIWQLCRVRLSVTAVVISSPGRLRAGQANATAHPRVLEEATLPACGDVGAYGILVGLRLSWAVGPGDQRRRRRVWGLESNPAIEVPYPSAP